MPGAEASLGHPLAAIGVYLITLGLDGFLVSYTLFLARSACSGVITQASTISSIFLSFGISLSSFFALLIFSLDAGIASL